MHFRTRHDGASTARTRALLAAIFTLLIGSHALMPERARAGECSNYADDRKATCREAVAVESARGIGLGTGVRATSVSTSALAYSPGALALGNLYHIEGNIDYIGVGDAVALGGAVVDSSTSKLGAGLALRGFLSGDGGYDGLDGRLGLGFALSDAFAIGLAGRYISLSREELGEDDELTDVELAQGFTLDASLRIIPTEGFQLDVAALNFVDLEESEVPVTIASSAAFAIADALSLGADVLVDVSTFENPELIIGGGLEFLAGEAIPLRGGYRADLARKTHAITVGLGYNDAQVGFDIGLRQNVASDYEAIKNETRVMASVRYFVH